MARLNYNDFKSCTLVELITRGLLLKLPAIIYTSQLYELWESFFLALFPFVSVNYRHYHLTSRIFHVEIRVLEHICIMGVSLVCFHFESSSEKNFLFKLSSHVIALLESLLFKCAFKGCFMDELVVKIFQRTLKI